MEFDVVAEDFDAYLDSLFLEVDVAEDWWGGVHGLDSDDPVRQAVEQWLDHELPGWRTRPWAE